jgi:hypothetical protein
MREGAPPEVDAYIDDGRGGQYMPYREDFEGQAEIWNRNSADNGAEHQQPIVGTPNFLYATVKNRGTRQAADGVVRAFQSKISDARVWPTDWKATTTVRVPLPANIPPGGQVVAGPFQWTPEFERQKLLVSVSATGDLSNLETVTAGPIVTSRLVPLDNNIAQRTL